MSQPNELTNVSFNELITFGIFNFHTIMRKIATALLFTLLTTLSILAQNTGTIRGFVYNGESGEPMIFTNVFLEGTTYGAQTDVNGYYSISKIPVGKYTLASTQVGYDTAKIEINLKKDQIITQKLSIKEVAVNLKTFSVNADKQERQTKPKVSEITLTPEDIDHIPSVGGEKDLVTGLTTLPGFILTGDQGGQLYVRGGSPVQNKVLLDGMIIYSPFHSIGLFSVFDLDVIRNTDVYTGGYNAEYGGRISSIMDITTRDGNKNRFGGKISATTMGAKMLLEGPLKKPKKIGGSSTSFIISAKTNYLENSQPIFYDYLDRDLPYTFTDLYGKISFNGATGSKLNLFGFNFVDDVNYELSDLGWTSSGAGGNFLLVPQGSAVLVEGNFAYSNYEIELVETNRTRSSAIAGYNAGLDFTYFIKDNEIKYGAELVGFSTDFSYVNSLNRVIEQNQNTSEIAGYIKYRWNKGKLILEPSFRAQYYASLNNFSPEPRLRAKYNISNDFRIKMAAGLYSQNLISANSDLDVVNLFNGFLAGPENLQDEFETEDDGVRDVTHKLQKAQHLVAGFEWDLTNNMNINVEGYYKIFTQLSTLNRNKVYDDTPENSEQPDYLKKDFIIEEGEAYGVDFTYSYKYKRFYLWFVYSLAYVDRWDGEISYNPVFDRRHNINIVGSYTFGKKLNWEVSARWNYGSGFPFTQTQGFYEKFDFQDGIGSDYVTSNGDIGVEYADVNDGRLPSYHRLDLNIRKTIALTTNSELEVNAGVTNAYNRSNVFYFDRVNYERVDQLPIMPSFGFSLTF